MRSTLFRGILMALALPGIAMMPPVTRGDDKAPPETAATAGRSSKVVPDWALECIRGDIWVYQGKLGLKYDPFPRTIAPNTAGLDYWQANHFIVCRDETRDYLYNEYTPTQVHYVKGTLPAFEALVSRYTQ